MMIPDVVNITPAKLHDRYGLAQLIFAKGTIVVKDKKNLYWIIDWYKTIDYSWLGKRKIIHGYVPFHKSKIEKMFLNISKNKVLNIDNGCYMKEEEGFGILYCLKLNSMQITFQQNID